MRIAALTTALLMVASSASANAADVYEAEPIESGWTFTFAPYAWAAGIEGEVGLFGFEPQDVDASFSDIMEHFDIGAMAVAEARNGPFSLAADIFYVNLGTDVDTPFGILANSIEVEAKSFWFTGLVGYSLIYDETVNLDVIAGARVWHSDTSFEVHGGLLDGNSADDGDTWIDPLVGIKGHADLGSGFYLEGWGMIGGFGVSSDFMWDVFGGLGYEFSDIYSLIAGYRAVGVDYENDGFVYDVIQQGPVLGAVFRF
jgi:hypothetical protein